VIVGVLFVELLDEVEIDLLLLLFVEIFKGDGEVHAGLNGYVEGADAVGREDEDTVIVFENAKEDYHSLVEDLSDTNGPYQRLRRFCLD